MRLFLLFVMFFAAGTMPALAQNADQFDSNGFEHMAGRKPTVEDVVKERILNAEDRNYLSLSLENDSFGGGKDENYTSGVRLSYFDTEAKIPNILVDKIAEANPFFEINDSTSTFYNIGQNIYTPQDIENPDNQEDERPWAGWIYGSVGLATVTDNRLDEVEITLGMVGPVALAEQTQKFVHNNITNSPSPRGWSNQLKNEPGLIVSWRRRFPTWYAQNIGGYRLRLEPDVNASVGNIYTYAGTGITATIGPFKDRIQDTPPRVRPAMAGTGFFDTPDDEISWYLFGGVDGRAVARNIFLDGNTFTDSDSVDKKHFVADLNAGLAITYDDYRVAYTANYRTKEFDGQSDPSIFGSVTFSTRF